MIGVPTALAALPTIPLVAGTRLVAECRPCADANSVIGCVASGRQQELRIQRPTPYHLGASAVLRRPHGRRSIRDRYRAASHEIKHGLSWQATPDRTRPRPQLGTTSADNPRPTPERRTDRRFTSKAIEVMAYTQPPEWSHSSLSELQVPKPSGPLSSALKSSPSVSTP